MSKRRLLARDGRLGQRLRAGRSAGARARRRWTRAGVDGPAWWQSQLACLSLGHPGSAQCLACQRRRAARLRRQQRRRLRRRAALARRRPARRTGAHRRAPCWPARYGVFDAPERRAPTRRTAWAALRQDVVCERRLLRPLPMFGRPRPTATPTAHQLDRAWPRLTASLLQVHGAGPAHHPRLRPGRSAAGAPVADPRPDPRIGADHGPHGLHHQLEQGRRAPVRLHARWKRSAATSCSCTRDEDARLAATPSRSRAGA